MRLQAPVRLTALLLVLAPLTDLVLGAGTPAPADPVWRLAVARSLPAGLLAPTGGALILAVLAIVSTSAVASGLALAAAGVAAVPAGLALGILASETWTPVGSSPPLDLVWPQLLAVLVLAALATLSLAVVRHGHRPPRGAALPEPRPPGIDLVD